MPMFCVVYGCSNRSNQETTRSFCCVRTFVVHKGGKGKKLTEKMQEKVACKPASLVRRSRVG